MRHAVVIAVALALALSGCSGGTGADENTAPEVTDAVSAPAAPVSSTPESSTAPATSPSTAATASQPAAPTDIPDYTEICTAAYDAGIGNAATQVRASWIADCAAECALPANRESCDAMGAQLGID